MSVMIWIRYAAIVDIYRCTETRINQCAQATYALLYQIIYRLDRAVTILLLGINGPRTLPAINCCINDCRLDGPGTILLL